MISLVSKLALWQRNAAQTRPAETGITNLRVVYNFVKFKCKFWGCSDVKFVVNPQCCTDEKVYICEIHVQHLEGVLHHFLSHLENTSQISGEVLMLHRCKVLHHSFLNLKSLVNNFTCVMFSQPT